MFSNKQHNATYIICRVHLKHTVSCIFYFLKCSCKYSLLFFFNAPHLVSSKSYKIICLKATVLITDDGLKNLSHLGLCGALSCCINSIAISDVASGLGGMACTVPICGNLHPCQWQLASLSAAPSQHLCFVVRELPMYICKGESVLHVIAV